MKIRNGFVSNSSSSSFVVISKNPTTMMDTIPENLLVRQPLNQERAELLMSLPMQEGELHFNWQFERYYDFISKCNYAVAQFMDLDRDLKSKYKRMFEHVLSKHIKSKDYFKVVYDYNFFYWDSILDADCYIDHQSAYYEYNEKGHYIFLSEENLENFLFNTESFIQCGNDNSDGTEEYYEARRMEGSEYGEYSLY